MKNTYFSAFKAVVTTGMLSAVIVAFSILGILLTNGDSETSATVVGRNMPTIVIDPGHGGEDGGAYANGVLEKDINLAVSSILYSYLSMTDYNVVMTRTDDRMLYNDGEEFAKKRFDILNRISFTERFDNAIFVSIHQNKFEIPKYKGLQVYYSPNHNDSKALADAVQKNAKTHLDPDNNREIKQADYKIKVLDNIKSPAILVECGFISNPGEALLLCDYSYQKKLAFVIFASLANYLENNGE